MQVSTQTRIEVASDVAFPLTSLIICSRNRPQLLLDLVRSVLEGDQLPAEIIVVDDSDQPNVPLVTFTPPLVCDLRYFWTRSRGLSRANNDGVAAATHDVLVFTQDDVLVTRTWFSLIVRDLLDAGSGSVVTGRVPPEDSPTTDHFAPSTISENEPRVYRERTGEGVLYMQNMAMYRSTYEATGIFDERLGPGTPFPAGEDNDYAYRLLCAGYRIVYCPNAVVYHRAWRGAESLLPLRWKYGVARGGVYAKHVSRRDRFMLSQMLRDIRIHLFAAASKIRRARQQAFGDLVLAFGIAWGALRWWFTEARRLWLR